MGGRVSSAELTMRIGTGRFGSARAPSAVEACQTVGLCGAAARVEVTGADLASGVGKERAAESYGLIKHKYAKPTSSPSDETHCVAYIIGSAGAASAPIMTLS